MLFEQYEALGQGDAPAGERLETASPSTTTCWIWPGGPCIYKRIVRLRLRNGVYGGNPLGDLYPCHQFVGDERYRLGSIYEGVCNEEIQEQFRRCNAYARPECRDCWAQLYCSGGCAANAYHATGSIAGIYEYGCELFKKRMECAIMMKAAQTQED